MHIDCSGKILDLSNVAIMGVLNVTPDSFSDGGKFQSQDNALKQAELMIDAGANIIDIGGESTRPGAAPVSDEQELERVIPIIEILAKNVSVPISIDTSKASVMLAAADAGAGLINDVYGFRNDGALAAAAKTNLPICIMHMQGEPRTMQANPSYDSLLDDVLSFFQSRINLCHNEGITSDKIIVDPGFGFGKTLEHNIELLNNLDYFKSLEVPILAGLSRKSMIGQLIGLDVDDREYASIALALMAVQSGANIVRVHDVKGTSDAVRLYEAIKNINTNK